MQQMTSLVRPLLRPLPLLSISTAGILAAAAFSQVRQPVQAKMSTVSGPWPVKAYEPRHKTWPYHSSDFRRADPSPDSSFYDAPRYVNHIDDAAIASLRSYYDTVLPRSGRILDFCSSWVSHYPKDVEDRAAKGDLQVTGMGMNAAELKANRVLNSGRILVDLNQDPDIAGALASAGGGGDDDDDAKQHLDAATCVVSIDYLIKPIDVLKSLLTVTKPGGTVHLTVSNRCFPTKAIHRWLEISEAERLQMVGDYLYFSGWKNIEIVELSNGRVESSENHSATQGSLQSLMSIIGMGHRDPLWVVRATK